MLRTVHFGNKFDMKFHYSWHGSLTNTACHDDQLNVPRWQTHIGTSLNALL